MTRIISLKVSVQLCKSIQQPLVVFLTLSLLAIILVHHRSHLLSIARDLWSMQRSCLFIYFTLVSLNRWVEIKFVLYFTIVTNMYLNISIFLHDKRISSICYRPHTFLFYILLGRKPPRIKKLKEIYNCNYNSSIIIQRYQSKIGKLLKKILSHTKYHTRDFLNKIVQQEKLFHARF